MGFFYWNWNLMILSDMVLKLKFSDSGIEIETEWYFEFLIYSEIVEYMDSGIKHDNNNYNQKLPHF